LNDEVTSLNAQLKTCKSDFDKLKFARDAYTIGRHPSIKDGLGFRKETKNLTSQKALVLNKEKGKAPMANSSQKNHAYIYDRKYSRNTYNDGCYDHAAYCDSHAMFASSSTFVHGRSRPGRNYAMHHAPRKMCNEPTAVFHACNTLLGRRRRRYPSLQPSSISLRQRKLNKRQGTPFVFYTTRRRPTTTSPRPTSSLDLEAHVGFGPL
jgi:hypothetical protein